MKTGEYRWHFQQVHHDIWDYDSAEPRRAVRPRDRRRARAKASRSRARRAGSTSSTARTARRSSASTSSRCRRSRAKATAATQPYPRGDAFVPQQIDIAPEGYSLVNGGSIFTPFWTDSVHREARASSAARTGRRARYDPDDAATLYVCAGDRGELVCRAREIGSRAPARAAQYYIGGASARNPLPQLRHVHGARLRTNKIVWQQHWAEHVLQRRDDDGRRARVRRPQRRPAHGARFERRQEALGIPDGRRHERARQRVRARRASNTSSPTRPAMCSRARRRATASGCSRSTARSSPCHPGNSNESGARGRDEWACLRLPPGRPRIRLPRS